MNEESIIYIACDHAGYPQKEWIVKHLTKKKLRVEDLGVFNKQAVDYPDYAVLLAKKVEKQPNSRGILLCGTGIGMTIAANRFSHIRAALCYTRSSVVLARTHNDANVLVLPARTIKKSQMRLYSALFLTTPFEGNRHQQRVEKLSTIGITKQVS